MRAPSSLLAALVIVSIAGTAALIVGPSRGAPADSEPVAPGWDATSGSPLAVPSSQDETACGAVPSATRGAIDHVLEGRVVSDFDGRPLGSTCVRLRSDRGSKPETTTDAAGRFRFAHHEAEAWARLEVVLSPNAWQAFAPFQLAAGAQVHAPLRALAFVTVRGRVCDDIGQPVAGLGITACRRDRTGVVPSSVSAVTDENGCFAFPGPIPAGTWLLRWPTPWRSLEEPATIEIAPGAIDRTLELRVRRPPTRAPIRGTVVDEAGAAVAGVVIIDNRYAWHLRPKESTGPDGRFELTRPDAVEDSVELHVLESESRRLVVVAPTDKVAWGNDDVRLVVRRLQRLVVRATSDGVPVERYFVRCQQEGHYADWAQALVPGRHDGGLATIEGAPPGKCWIAVFPEDERLWQSAPLSVDVGSSLGVVEVQVPRRASVDVEVLDWQGAAMAGCEVELLHSPQQPPTPMSPTGDLAKAGIHDLLRPPLGSALGLARATTDDRGRCVVAGPRGGSGLYLRARAADKTAHVEAIVLAAQSQRVTLRLAQPVRLRGRVVAMEALAPMFPDISDQLMMAGRQGSLQNASPWVVVQDANGATLARAPLGADGAFDLDPLQPGRVRLAISGRVARPGYGAIGNLSLAEADVAPGMAPLILDARRAALREVRGRVRIGQAPLGDAGLAFARVEGSWHGGAQTGPDGSLVVWLPDGRYRIQSSIAATGELVVRAAMGEVDLVLAK